MSGMNNNTGQALAGMEHLQQSLYDILFTPLGSRVMRRDYGSRIFELIDAPAIRRNMLAIYVAVAEALAKWEPRFRLQRVELLKRQASQGAFGVALTGYIQGQLVTLDIAQQTNMAGTLRTESGGALQLENGTNLELQA